MDADGWTDADGRTDGQTRPVASPVHGQRPGPLLTKALEAAHVANLPPSRSPRPPGLGLAWAPLARNRTSPATKGFRARAAAHGNPDWPVSSSQHGPLGADRIGRWPHWALAARKAAMADSHTRARPARLGRRRCTCRHSSIGRSGSLGACTRPLGLPAHSETHSVLDPQRCSLVTSTRRLRELAPNALLAPGRQNTRRSRVSRNHALRPRHAKAWRSSRLSPMSLSRVAVRQACQSWPITPPRLALTLTRPRPSTQNPHPPTSGQNPCLSNLFGARPSVDRRARAPCASQPRVQSAAEP